MTTVQQYREAFRARLDSPMKDSNEEFIIWLVERVNELKTLVPVGAVDLGSGTVRRVDDPLTPPGILTATHTQDGLTYVFLDGPAETGKPGEGHFEKSGE